MVTKEACEVVEAGEEEGPLVEGGLDLGDARHLCGGFGEGDPEAMEGGGLGPLIEVAFH